MRLTGNDAPLLTGIIYWGMDRVQVGALCVDSVERENPSYQSQYISNWSFAQQRPHSEI